MKNPQRGSITIVVLVVLLIGIVAGLYLYNIKNKKVEGDIYINQNLQYQIVIPEGFVTVKDYWGKDTLIIWNGPLHKGYPVHGFPFVGIKIDPLGERVIDPATPEFKFSALFKGGEVQVFEPQTLKNGRQAYVLEFTSTLNSDAFRSRYLLVVKDGTLYRVGVRAILNDWKKNESAWIEIMDSFEI